MKTNDITLSAEAITAINGLQHNCGTYRYYSDTLSRLYNLVLLQGDEIGMDDTEILHTLRVLVSLKADLACIASHDHTSDSCDDDAAKVEAAFSFLDDDGGDSSESPAPISQEGDDQQ